MKKITLLFFVLFAIGIYSCDESNLDSVESTEFDLDAASKNGNNGNKNDLPFTGYRDFESIEDDQEFCGKELECTFWAGQTIDAGSVTVTNDGEYLYVKVHSKAGFQDVEENIKMWIGLEVPDRRPSSGQFPYKVTEDGDTHIFKIKLSTLPDWNECGDEYIIIVHGDVLTEEGNPESGETAYGGCDGTDGQPWWAHMEYTTQCCDEKVVGYMIKWRNGQPVPNRVTCFEDNSQGETIYGFSNRLDYYTGLPSNGGTFQALTPPGQSWPVMATVSEDCDLTEVQEIGIVTLLLGDFQDDAGIKLTFKGSNGYENTNGVWSGLVSWTEPVSPDEKLIPELESERFVLNVVNGEAEIEIDEADWPGDPTQLSGGFYQYHLISGFVLNK